jgi:hypothetical protein
MAYLMGHFGTDPALQEEGQQAVSLTEDKEQGTLADTENGCHVPLFCLAVQKSPCLDFLFAQL